MLTEVGRGRCSGSVTVWRWLLGRIGLLGLLGLHSLPHAGMLWALLTGTKEPHEGATEVQFPQIPRAFLVTPHLCPGDGQHQGEVFGVCWGS